MEFSEIASHGDLPRSSSTSTTRLIARLGWLAIPICLPITNLLGQEVVLDTVLRHPTASAAARVGFGVQVAMRPGDSSGTALLIATAKAAEVLPKHAGIRRYRRVNGVWALRTPFEDPEPPRPGGPGPFNYTPSEQYSIGFGDPRSLPGNIGFFSPGGGVLVGSASAVNYRTFPSVESRGAVYVFDGTVGYLNNGEKAWGHSKLTPPATTYGPSDAFAIEFGRVLTCAGPWVAVTQRGPNAQDERVQVYNADMIRVLAPLAPIPGTFPARMTISRPPVTRAIHPSASDSFGDSLALSANGEWLAVGAPGESSNATGVNPSPVPLPTPSTRLLDSGAVYLYRLGPDTTATLVATLKADNPDAGDAFGTAIAMDAGGETLFVGAPNEDSASSAINSPSRGNDGSGTPTSLDRGAVYVFRRSGSTWALTDYLKPSSLGFNAIPRNQLGSHRFGRRLAVDGPHLAVQGGHLTGFPSVHLFRRDLTGAWTARQRIAPPTNNWTLRNGSEFGTGLAFADGFLAICDPRENNWAGAVAIYSGVYAAPPAPPKPITPIVSLPGGPAGPAALTWFGQPGASYRLQKTTDMNTWTPILTAIADPQDGLIEVSDPIPTSPTSFYRLEGE